MTDEELKEQAKLINKIINMGRGKEKSLVMGLSSATYIIEHCIFYITDGLGKIEIGECDYKKLASCFNEVAFFLNNLEKI